MKLSALFIRLCLFSTSLLLSLAHAQAPATGTIVGRITHRGSGDYVERARVTIEGTSLETFTDTGGQYRLVNVPAGQARVKVFFTGMEVQTAAVGVTAGATARRDFELGGGVVTLAEVVVASSKEMAGAAIAINEQRFASNIVNVVAADEFGAVLENNVGDFLKFLPGITIDFIGGAARSISMGGVPPEYVPITVGGFDLSTVSGGGTTRNVDFHTISMNNVARIEAIHSPTPESPGAALAGSVNMIPRSSFDYARPTFSYSAFMMMRDNDRHLFSKTPGPRWVRTRKVHPGFDFSYVKPVNDRFGFTLTGATTKQYTEEERTANTWRAAGSATNGITAATAATQYPDTTPDRPYLTDYVVEDGGKHTQRTSLGVTVDYKFSAYDRVSFAFDYALYDSPLNQRNLTFLVQRVSPGEFAPTFTHGQTGRGELRTASQSRHHARLKYMPMLTYRHNGPIWKAEAGLGHSHEELTFRSIDKGYLNNVTSIRQNVTINFDDNFYLRPGRISVFDGTSGAPLDPYLLSNYALSTGNGTSSRTQDVKRSTFANLRREFDLNGLPLTLKGGVDLRQSIRDNRTSTPSYTFVGTDGRASGNPAAAGSDDGAGILLDEVFSERTAPYGFPKIQYTSTQEAYNYLKEHPTYATTNQATLYTSEVNGSKLAREVVSSAYIRGDLALLNRRLKLVGGVRAEQTNINAEGPLNDPTRNYQRDASGRVIRGANGSPLLIVPTSNALGVSQLTLLDRAAHTKKEYLRLFPNLNASYNVRENLIARAAFYKSVGRPNFNQYAGGVTLPDAELPPSNSNRITVNNAAIKAWSAQTTKVRLEYYFEGVGQVSVGAFRRDFENFFGATVFAPTPEFLALYGIDAATYGNFDVSTQYNIPGSVRMTGCEFDYKQALTFLPTWARGVQVFANATALRATGDENANFAGYVPRSYNWGVSLTRPKFNVRANWNYRGFSRGSPVTGRSIQAGTFNWTSKLLFLDLQGEYYLKKRFAVFASMRNIGDATNDTQIYGPATPELAQFRQRTTYGSLWSFGVKGSF
ncbi:carboxypeptidase regulatory-like domain-containing protein [Horticoccus sp. 23ND18S-11]|uniref:carboxypeptidase regulatory-like domain-containing protein n=1 Tax=Horticoccus sp. 23ND18S-11 TaxID=3391832 RepID=UPI0039C99F77